MQLNLQQQDIEHLRASGDGKIRIDLRAYWNDKSGSLAILAKGYVILESTEGIVKAVFDELGPPQNPFTPTI